MYIFTPFAKANKKFVRSVIMNIQPCLRKCVFKMKGEKTMIAKNCILFRLAFVIIFITMSFLVPTESLSKNKEKEDKGFHVPKNVLPIEKENTFPNTPEDIEMVEPSETVKQLLEGLSPSIDNPDLIKLMNESTLKPSPLSFGYRAEVYLGRWPLHYESESTSLNWDYQHINLNELNNQTGTDLQELRYQQQKEVMIKGA